MAAIIKQNSGAWKWRKASRKKAKLRILRKMGVNCARNYQRYWQYVKKQTQKNRGVPKTTMKPRRLEVNKSATKTT